MSVAEGKQTDSQDASMSNSKCDESERKYTKNWTRNKNQKDWSKNWRSNNDYKRNQGSYRGGNRNDKFDRKPYKRNWSNSQQDGKRTKFEVGNRLKECDVGITEFIGDDGFFGVIKERYTDFHVNEIALDGEMAKLTNQDIPQDDEENENLEDLKTAVSEAIWEQLQTLKDPESSPIEIDVTDMDKDQRRTIHTIAKKLTNVVSQTIDKEDKKIMMIIPNKKDTNINQHFRKDNRTDWTKRNGDYCYFLLHKVNMDTMDALSQLSMNLRIKPNNFNYAGTKDRRAWTTQWVSLKRVEPFDILKVAKNIRGLYVGNFKFVKEPLKLGMLHGNHFRIALRNVNGTDEQIEKTMVSLRDNGFINYYGLQRFGTVAAIPTYEIGKALLQGKWHEAIELILKPREGEQDRDLAEARRIYETTKDACAAYKKIRRCDKIEATLLKGLCISDGTNPQGALDSIPRNARLMYIHAYQSFVWNHMVSRRIKELGKKPVVGDLVYDTSDVKQNNDDEEATYENENENEVETEENTDSDKKVSESENETREEESNADEMTETTTESASNSIKEVMDATENCLKIDENDEENKTTSEKDEIEESYNLPAVKILKEEDLPNYTLADVLMPQVGWKVTYPPYAKPWYDEFLAKDGLTTDLRQKTKKYSLGGTYRKILQVPSDLSWKIMHYKEKHSDLIMCDINEMRQASPPQDYPDGQYKALVLEMPLKSSTYATMALREILKFDTSPQLQAARFAACNPEKNDSATPKDGAETENTCSSQNDNGNVNEEQCSEAQKTKSDILDEQNNDKMEVSVVA